MRELKFRVYGGLLKKEFRAYDNVLINMQDGELKIKPCDWHGRGDDVIIEQYTGLKDKNGKEIYKGDILLDYYDGEDAFVVEWDKDTASFILTDTRNMVNVSFDNFYPDKDLEIIGNIHENPELLEKK